MEFLPQATKNYVMKIKLSIVCCGKTELYLDSIEKKTNIYMYGIAIFLKKICRPPIRDFICSQGYGNYSYPNILCKSLGK